MINIDKFVEEFFRRNVGAGKACTPAGVAALMEEFSELPLDQQVEIMLRIERSERCGCGKMSVTMYECVECGTKACEECATNWKGNICCRCIFDNPVFFNSHSRTHGDVDPKNGAIR